jgi:hypothetical protein
MGLLFRVGNPGDALSEPFAAQVSSDFARQFGKFIVLDSTEDPYYSAELSWSGWGGLQRLAVERVTKERLPHFLSMDAWCGCYVPVETEPHSIPLKGITTALDIASLAALIKELELVGRSLGLPTDELGVQSLAARHREFEMWGKDDEVQTYAELLLAARVAERRRQVLWVVK